MPQPPMQLLDLEAHLHAELGVEVRQRLVEQEHRRLAHDRPAHRDALALPARELPRPPLEQRLELEDVGRALHPLADLGAATCRGSEGRTPCCRTRSCAGTARSSGTPSRCRGPWARASLTTRSPMTISPSDHRLEAGDHPQHRRLAAAGRSDDDDEFAVGDVQVDAVDDRARPEALAHVVEFDLRHVTSRCRPAP